MENANSARPIQIWHFHEAPDELKQLSGHGGDEDWLMLIPPNYEYIPWYREEGFGCCDVSRHNLENGDTVLIGAHA